MSDQILTLTTWLPQHATSCLFLLPRAQPYIFPTYTSPPPPPTILRLQEVIAVAATEMYIYSYI